MFFQQEGEYQSIFVPMYDQSGAQANAQGTLIPTGTPHYQPSGTLAMMPVQYPSSTYGNPPTAIYPGQIVYTSEQYPQAPSASPQQIPISYPTIGYSYPCNGNKYFP